MTDPVAKLPPRVAENEVRGFWTRRGVPPEGGYLGKPDAPLVRQFLGMYSQGDPASLVAHRAVAADVDARFLALSGRRTLGTLRREGWPAEELDPNVHPVLAALGIWTGGDGRQPWDAVDRRPSVQKMVGRLARRGSLVVRDAPLRICPACAAPRSPERTIYQEEVGDTYLVRFPLEGSTPPVDALAWVDAPWRLLGATALLVNPEMTYAVVEYRHKDATARLLTSRSSVERLRTWLPGVDLSVVEERAGREFVGRPYAYPLRHEFPGAGALAAPAGTVQAVPEVGDSGTGIVPLVPGHGGTDAQIAEKLGIPGWPLLTVHGRFDLTLMHKYSGLDLETGNQFVARDLTESGAVLARLRVLRGVPYCAICGHAMFWMPGRAWCLEPGRLPAEQTSRYSRLLPHERPIGQIEVTPWPVSETVPATGGGTYTLLECGRCERLDGPDGTVTCPCGGTRRSVTRRLLPSILGTLAAWGRSDPLSPSDVVRIYASERRRAPTLVHHLAAMAAVDGAVSDVGITVLPTVSDVDLKALIETQGADAVRSAFVRTETTSGATGTFEERCRQEANRFARLVGLSREVIAASDRATIGALAEPIEPSDRELETEDRAILARWARTETLVLAAYDRWTASAAHRQIFRFVEHDLLRYRELVRTRWERGGFPPTKRAALRTYAQLLRSIAKVLAPIAPFTAETIHRSLVSEPRSLFEEEALDREKTPPEDPLALAWDRWRAVVLATDRFRRDHHLPASTPLPRLAMVVPDDQLGEYLRADRPEIERLARVERIEIGSPRSPWEGRRRRLVPVESEVQRAYPAIATQVLHLLQRLPPRRPGDEAAGRELSVVVQGLPRRVPPEMFTTVDALPDRFVPTPFSLGEMYVELPKGDGATAKSAPPLTADAAWLVRRIAQSLRRTTSPDEGAPRVALVVAIDPLASELREHAIEIATYLGLTEIRVTNGTEPVPPADQISGRTRTGARWWVGIPGLATGRRAVKVRAGRRRGRRVPEPTAPPPDDEIDFTDEAVIAREETIREIGQEVDGLLAIPLLGPSKVSIAWDAGFRTVEELSDAPFDALVALPGFGRPFAAALYTKLGKPVPPPPARTPRKEVPATPREPRPPPGFQRTDSPLADSPIPVSAPPTSEMRPSYRPAEPSWGVPPVAGESAATAEEPGGSVTLPPVESGIPAAASPLSQDAPPLPPPEGLPDVGSRDSPEPPAPPAASIGLPEPRLPGPVLRPAGIPSVLPPAVAPPPPAVVAEPAVVPAPPPPPAGLDIEVSDSLLQALQPFLEATAVGHHGLALVREMPERIRVHVGPRPVSVYWLTNLVRDNTVRPNDLAAVQASLHKALDTGGVTAVFLEGVEYLILLHGLDRVVELLRDLDRTTRAHEARAWLHITPSLLSPSDLDRLVSEVRNGPPAAPTPESTGEPTVPSSSTEETNP